MLGVRLDKETEKQLELLAKETRRTKSFYAKEARCRGPIGTSSNRMGVKRGQDGLRSSGI